MSLDSRVKLEAISSLLGQTVHGIKSLANAGDTLSIDQFNLLNLIGARPPYVEEFFINEEEFFDPQYDCDFGQRADWVQFRRGNEPYGRPIGWYRIALKVKGKYPDGDVWLGTEEGLRRHSVPGEWPVSYHGTSLEGARGIIRTHYRAGPRTVHGRGIYSTPDIHVAEKEDYAKTFVSSTTGKSYKVILQNRINPEKREICQRQTNYWLIRIPEGTSAEDETCIVESAIRPYGILIQEIKDLAQSYCTLL